MIRVFAAVCLLIVSLTAQADVGLGVSVKSSTAIVYLPVTAGRFMFEPFVRYTDRESETTRVPDVPPVPPGTSSLEVYSVGLGIFRMKLPTERMGLYYGGRIARLEERSESSTLITSTVPITIPPSTLSSELDGYSVAPTVGLTYSVAERVSVGVEVGVDHTEMDGISVNDPSTGPPTTVSAEVEGNDVRAEIIFRFLF
jgi:hypothetical protein